MNHLSTAEEIPMLAYKVEWTCKLIDSYLWSAMIDTCFALKDKTKRFLEEWILQKIWPFSRSDEKSGNNFKQQHCFKDKIKKNKKREK